jgi:hypothetical protein
MGHEDISNDRRGGRDHGNEGNEESEDNRVHTEEPVPVLIAVALRALDRASPNRLEADTTGNSILSLSLRRGRDRINRGHQLSCLMLEKIDPGSEGVKQPWNGRISLSVLG